MRIFMLFCCLVAAPFLAFAQDTILPGSEVRVEKLFDARLAEAKRIELRPSLPQIDTTRVPQRYEVIPVVSDITYDPPKIRPLAIKVDAPPAPYKGFARAGVGFAPGWIGDVGYVTRNESIALRGDLHTYGFQATDDSDQRNSEVNGLLGGTYYADNGLAVDLDLDYDGQRFRYYGFEEAVNDTSMTLTPEQNQQYFSIFGLRAGVRNTKPTEIGIDYFFRVGAHFLSDNFTTKERNSLIELGGRKDLNEQWYAEAELEIDLTSFSATSIIENTGGDLNNYSFIPTVGAHFDQLGFRIGATISNFEDNFKFFPNAEVSYGLGGGFVIVAGADGGLRKNNYTRMTRYLPYLVRDIELRNAEEYRFYAGVQGQTAGVNYKATASYTHINNLAIYAQDSLEVYKFRPAFDTANVIGLRVEANMPLANRFNGRLQLDTRTFSLNSAEKPYLLPSFDAQVQVSYEVIEDKFTASAILTAQNALPFAAIGPTIQPNPLPESDLTSTLVDLSIHGNYWFAKKVGGFVQLNNLFNNQRRKFPFYPVLGTNVMAGIVTRF
ncbi:MAG: hypothetical protein AB8F78_02845 [Saprospiraceae bacterium]